MCGGKIKNRWTDLCKDKEGGKYIHMCEALEHFSAELANGGWPTELE